MFFAAMESNMAVAMGLTRITEWCTWRHTRYSNYSSTSFSYRIPWLWYFWHIGVIKCNTMTILVSMLFGNCIFSAF